MSANIESIVSEYASLDPIWHRPSSSELDWDQLNAALVNDCDWTPVAAQTLTHLVREYGSFVLRNACALAIACEVEDGESRI